MTLPPATASLVAALNQRHNTLAARWVDGRPPAEDVQALISDIVAAGAVVPSGAERDALRNLLYFWASDQTSRGERPREASLPALAPFVESPAAAPPPVTATVLPPDPADSRSTDSAPSTAAGGAAIESGAVLGKIGATGAKSVSLEAVSAPTVSWRTAIDVASTVAQVVDLVRKLGTKEATPVRPEATNVSAGPPSDAEARAIVRIAALARQWRLTDEINKKGYLLTGKALVEASLFVDRDPDIAALVAASEQQEKVTDKQRRLARRVLYGLVALAFCAIVVAGYQYVNRQEDEKQQLRDASAQRAAERDRIMRTVQAAVEALGGGDLDPLKKLLVDLGGAPQAIVDGLQYNKKDALKQASDATFTPPQRKADVAQAPPIAVTCSGYLWFGSQADSRLSDGRDPGTLKMGDSATLDNRSDIRLRSDWPADGYFMTRQIGLVPAGSQVKLSSEPKAYHRGSGDQIWAQVTVPRTFCTTVFLQYSGTPDKRGAVVSALRDLGVQVPPAEKVAAAAGLAEVRYYWPEDEPVAQQVATALSSFNGGNKLGVVLVKNVPTKPSPGTIEAWLDFSR